MGVRGVVWGIGLLVLFAGCGGDGEPDAKPPVREEVADMGMVDMGAPAEGTFAHCAHVEQEQEPTPQDTWYREYDRAGRLTLEVDLQSGVADGWVSLTANTYDAKGRLVRRERLFPGGAAGQRPLSAVRAEELMRETLIIARDGGARTITQSRFDQREPGGPEVLGEREVSVFADELLTQRVSWHRYDGEGALLESVRETRDADGALLREEVDEDGDGVVDVT